MQDKLIKLMKVLKMIIFLPVEILFVLLYVFSSQRKKINMDLEAFARHHHRTVTNRNRLLILLLELMWVVEFRKLFLYRIGGIARYLMDSRVTVGIDVPRDKFGGGLYIQHGFGIVVSARSVGENCWINQMVTIGYRSNGCPTIGNNVRIGAGAIIIGDVKIGNNVSIGAGAIVLDDLPDNCTVASPKATIIKWKESLPESKETAEGLL